MGGGLQEFILGASLGVSELESLLCPHIPLLVTQSAVGSSQECPDLSMSIFYHGCRMACFANKAVVTHEDLTGI